MTGRELAWRVLAQEVQAAVEVEPGVGEKAASYLISPLGARLNRVALTGTLLPLEGAGVGPQSGFRRARLEDPTGIVSVTAGSFQPHGLRDLESIQSATPVLLVGKTSLYRPRAGPPSPSIRAESVHPVSEAEYRTFLAEAATQTVERMEFLRRLRDQPSATDSELRSAGRSPHWIRGARASLRHYPGRDLSSFYDGLRAVLVALGAASGPAAAASQVERPGSVSAPVVRRVQSEVPARSGTLPAALRPLEGRLLEVLDQLSEESADGYADMDELAERAARFGIAGDRMEELLNYLAENGTLEEPLVGKFRRAEGPPRD